MTLPSTAYPETIIVDLPSRLTDDPDAFPNIISQSYDCPDLTTDPTNLLNS